MRWCFDYLTRLLTWLLDMIGRTWLLGMIGRTWLTRMAGHTNPLTWLLSSIWRSNRLTVRLLICYRLIYLTMRLLSMVRILDYLTNLLPAQHGLVVNDLTILHIGNLVMGIRLNLIVLYGGLRVVKLVLAIPAVWREIHLKCGWDTIVYPLDEGRWVLMMLSWQMIGLEALVG